MYIESNQYQYQIFDSMMKQGFPVRPVVADRDKRVKALSLAARYQSHTVFHPTDDWCKAYENQLLKFPGAEHDDAVDAGSYMAAVLTLRASPKIRFFGGPE